MISGTIFPLFHSSAPSITFPALTSLTVPPNLQYTKV